MSLKKFKTLDVLFFTTLAVIFELLCYYLSTNLDDFKLIFLSYSIVLSLICVFRWGLIGAIVAFFGGLAACVASSEATLAHYIAYPIGNLLGVIIGAALFQYLLKREKLLKLKFLFFVYLVFDVMVVIFLRCVIFSLFDINNFGSTLINSLKNQIVMQSMSLVVMLIILAISARKKGNMLVEMKSYIKDIQDYQKLGGLKEIKESPKFNFDKPLTEADEMDEAYILDGGQLSYKELKELDAVMYEDVDEDVDPIDVLTSTQNKE